MWGCSAVCRTVGLLGGVGVVTLTQSEQRGLKLVHLDRVVRLVVLDYLSIWRVPLLTYRTSRAVRVRIRVVVRCRPRLRLRSTVTVHHTCVEQ